MSITLSASLLNTQIPLAFVLSDLRIPNPDAHGHSSPYIFGMEFPASSNPVQEG